MKVTIEKYILKYRVLRMLNVRQQKFYQCHNSLNWSLLRQIACFKNLLYPRIQEGMSLALSVREDK